MGDWFNKYWEYPLVTMADGAVISLSQITLALVISILGLLLARLVTRLVTRNLSRTHVGPDAANIAGKLVFYVLALVVFLTGLRLLHIPITALTFLSGAIAIGVGFGAQNLISNLISGWILMSERPVRVGDFVEVDDAKGTIEDVGNRSTRIRRTDGVHMLVPNSQMLERTLVNWTLVDKDIRTIVRVGVAYGSPTRKVEELLLQAASEHSLVKQPPAPTVIFDDFGDNALIFDLYFWCEVGGERDLRMIRSDLRHRIGELFAEAGITIAFPQRDVHLDTSRPLAIRMLNGNAGDDT